MFISAPWERPASPLRVKSWGGLNCSMSTFVGQAEHLFSLGDLPLISCGGTEQQLVAAPG